MSSQRVRKEFETKPQQQERQQNLCTLLHHTKEMCFVEVRSRTGHTQSTLLSGLTHLWFVCLYYFDACGTMRKSFIISCVLFQRSRSHTLFIVCFVVAFFFELFGFRWISPIRNVYHGLNVVVDVLFLLFLLLFLSSAVFVVVVIVVFRYSNMTE